MANLSANAVIRFDSDKVRIEEWVLDNSAAQEIYVGQPLIIDASADTVYLRGWLSTTTLVTATDIFVGIALGRVTVATADTETDNKVQAIVGGVVGFKSAVFTNADIGKAVGFSDSGTLVAVTIAGAADKCPMGYLRHVENGYAFVELRTTPIICAF